MYNQTRKTIFTDRRTVAYLAAWLVSSALMGGHPEAAQPAKMTITESQSGTRVRLAGSQTLEVRLKAQLGTGYSWALTPESETIMKVVDTRLETGHGAPGAMETQVFILRPNRSGSGTIEFVYRQPWRADAAPARTFSLNVDVDPDGAR